MFITLADPLTYTEEQSEVLHDSSIIEEYCDEHTQLHEKNEVFESLQKENMELAGKLTSINLELESVKIELENTKRNITMELNMAWQAAADMQLQLRTSKGEEKREVKERGILELRREIQTNQQLIKQLHQANLQKDHQMMGMVARIKELEQAQQAFLWKSKNILELQKQLLQPFAIEENEGEYLLKIPDRDDNDNDSGELFKDFNAPCSSQQVGHFNAPLAENCKKNIQSLRNGQFVSSTCGDYFETGQRLKVHQTIKKTIK